ncbi:ATP-dependent helicase [bacterium]|nr:ATP-dependent helicase [bacterium]
MTDEREPPSGSEIPEKLIMQRSVPLRRAAMRIDYESELNEEQFAAVSAGNGPILVLAGAGSGKTRVITYRVAYLVETGIRPGNILLTTFTNRAARSMLSRVEGLLGINLAHLTGGTFHSICNRLLRKYASVIGFSDGFGILDEDDAKRLMKRVRNESGIDLTGKLFPAPRVLKRIASLLVNTEIDLDDIIIEQYPQFARRILDFETVFSGYTAAKSVNDVMDYDDLLLWTYKLLSEHDDVRREIAGRFEHVLVDEYQDTNHLQAKLVDLWGSEHGNVFVVGDDAQSIYSFRGANYRNILDFPNQHSDAQIFKLETNYRSAPEILNLANEVIKDTPENFRKTLRPIKPSGARPSLVACRTPDDQAEYIAEKILELREQGIGLNDMGVLYRAHRNSQELEMALNHRGIPYFIRGGVRFMEMAHIKDLMAYLVVIGAPRNEIAWDRVLSMCDRVGARTVANILGDIHDTVDPLDEFLTGEPEAHGYGAGKTSIANLKVFLSDVLKEHTKLDPAILARTIFTKRYKLYMEAQYENAARRMEDIEQFIIFASRFDTLGAMMQEVALHGGFFGQEVAALDPAAVEEGRVCLSTIHQAKGLEWKVVFMIWLVEGMLPHSMTYDAPDALEEERRLFYVAITRAKDEIIMTYPQQRPKADFSIDLTRPSRYLNEVERSVYDEFVLEWDEPTRLAGLDKSSDGIDHRESSGPDMEKLGGKMLGGTSPGKSGGMWMPDIPAPDAFDEEDEDDEDETLDE